MNIGAMLMYPPNGWRTNVRTAAYAATPPGAPPAGRAHPTPGQGRHDHRGPGVPQQVDGVEPNGAVRERVEGEPGNHQRPVHVTAQLRRPVRRGERPPEPRRLRDQRIHHDDRDVVQRELIPESAEVDDDGAQSDSDVEPPSGHGPDPAPSRRGRQTSQPRPGSRVLGRPRTRTGRRSRTAGTPSRRDRAENLPGGPAPFQTPPRRPGSEARAASRRRSRWLFDRPRAPWPADAR